MSLFNSKEHNIGDTVYIATGDENLIECIVYDIYDDPVLGIHYVLWVDTYIDPFLEIRSSITVWEKDWKK